MKRFFLVAGEPSGDLLGGALMEGLRELRHGDVAFDGVGGPLMAAQGLSSRFPMSDLSVMGLAEVLPRAPLLLRRVRETAEAACDARPDALVTIDSPDFCLRVAAKVRRQRPDLRIIHYVAPSVWAWRPGRAAKMARWVDHVLALLPFEPPFMEAAGMTCDFVGHPVAAEERAATPAEAAEARKSLGVEHDRPLLVALPGSRAGEVARLAPIFAEVIRRLRASRPDLAVVVPAAGGVVEAVGALLPPDAEGWPKIVAPTGSARDEAEKRAVFRAADAALAASGTVSLELAAEDTPMVVAYKVNPVTAAMVRRLVRVDTVTLVNLVTETRVVPEFLQQDCTPDLITPALAALLFDRETAAPQHEAAAAAMRALGRGGEPPGLRAARSVLSAVSRLARTA